jgi:YesN/AraC family two-component response regulator
MPQTIDAFLLKPINKQELAGLIRKLLDNKNKA